MTVTQIPFSQTNLFSKLILDYISQHENVKPFYNYEVSIDAIESVIAEKQKETINRNVLVETIKKQYAGLEVPAHVSENIT